MLIVSAATLLEAESVMSTVSAASLLEAESV